MFLTLVYHELLSHKHCSGDEEECCGNSVIFSEEAVGSSDTRFPPFTTL